jgi:hypothetical protein
LLDPGTVSLNALPQDHDPATDSRTRGGIGAVVGGLFECAMVGVAGGHIDQDVDSTEFGGCVGEGSLGSRRIGHSQQDSQMVDR